MRILSFLLLLVLPGMIEAQMGITTNSNGTITITSYSNPNPEDVIIPAMTNGYPVTTIAASAFFSSSLKITSIFIPYSVTNIGGMFGGLHLTAINIDAQNPLWSSVNGVWLNKNQTTLIQFPEGKFGCTIPSTVNTIGNFAFHLCGMLTNVIIPGSVTTIGSSAFNQCNVTNVIIPSSVVSIGNSAFAFCYNLTGFTMSTNVTSIEHNTFDTCISLTNMTIPSSVTNIGMEAFFYCSSLKSVTIPNSLTRIGTNQFEDCSSLTSVTIPNTIISIADSAFDNDASLTNFTIPSSVTNIGWLAFDGCPGPRRVFFGGNAPTVQVQAFSSSPKTTIYYLPGTTNWGPTFAGRPTVLWNPQVQIGGPSFGVLTNAFGFTVMGTTNIPVVVEACADLDNPVWSALQTSTLTDGSVYFNDPQWTNYPARFYRLRSP